MFAKSKRYYTGWKGLAGSEDSLEINLEERRETEEGGRKKRFLRDKLYRPGKDVVVAASGSYKYLGQRGVGGGLLRAPSHTGLVLCEHSFLHRLTPKAFVSRYQACTLLVPHAGTLPHPITLARHPPTATILAGMLS